MGLKPLLLFAITCLSYKASAQAPTWSSDIAPIIYNNCATCHRAGGIAPFALMTYADATAQAYAINSDVQSGTMPPWPPDANFNHLAHERILSALQKAKIAAWVTGGMPQGNASLAPPQPVFSNSGDLPGTPDLTVQIPTYTSPATTTDMYRCFVLNSNLSADKYITAFEAIPGNRSIVHHVLVFADTTGTAVQLDAADPGPGYTSFGGIGTNNAIMLGGWVPGSAPVMMPQGFGVKLPHNAKIVVQIHYPAGTAGQVDSTRIRFFFSPTNTVRDVYILPVLNYNTNITPTLFIPANTVRSFTEHYTTPGIDLSLLGMAPHMHLLGQNINAFGITPTGDTQKYISIPDWEFHWQGFYMMKKIVKVPGGTNIYSNATYDNTTNNPDNPSSPPQDVHAGENTTDEMMLTYAVFSIYQPGDENILIDNGTTPTAITNEPYYKSSELLQPYPVPAHDEVIAKMYFDKSVQASLEVVNISGQVVQNVFSNQAFGEGYHTLNVSLRALAAGIYQLRLRAGNGVQVQKIVVER